MRFISEKLNECVEIWEEEKEQNRGSREEKRTGEWRFGGRGRWLGLLFTGDGARLQRGLERNEGRSKKNEMYKTLK